MTISVIQINCQNFEQQCFEVEFRALMKRRPDFILLNEVISNHHVYSDILTQLDGYESWFALRQTHWAVGGLYTYSAENHTPWGNMIIWNANRFLLKQSHMLFTHGYCNSFDQVTPSGLPVNIMAVKVIDKTGTEIVAMNTHGFYGGRGFGKQDCPERISQTSQWLKFASAIGLSKLVFGGDFNLNISTTSLWDAEAGLGAVNPIRKLGIPTTRTTLYSEAKRLVEPHAGYILHRGLKLESFDVLTQSLMSDHAPLIGTYSW